MQDPCFFFPPQFDVAAALARYELSHVHGAEHIRAMIVDDIRRALDDGRIVHAAELLSVPRHFLETHPEACQHPY